jgi:hypothetical protein
VTDVGFAPAASERAVFAVAGRGVVLLATGVVDAGGFFAAGFFAAGFLAAGLRLAEAVGFAVRDFA